jgi:Fe-S-cluster containining protein
MLHGRVAVYMDDGNWYLAVYTVCDQLQPDFRCGIYNHRPKICRDYTTDECEFEDGGVHDLFFETPEQIYEYMVAFLDMDVEKEYWERGKQLPML